MLKKAINYIRPPRVNKGNIHGMIGVKIGRELLEKARKYNLNFTAICKDALLEIIDEIEEQEARNGEG